VIEEGYKKKPDVRCPALKERLAATYSRGTYRTTTIGELAFHVRVRDGIGWFHYSITTKVTA
jgi:hypothetical protein